jgi:putative hydrolase of the HAD superfamily
MAIKNIIFDVGNVIVRWSPTLIIQKTFPDLQPSQEQYLLEHIFRSETWKQLNLGKLSEQEAKQRFMSTIDGLDNLRANRLFDHIKNTQELIPGVINIIQMLHANGYPLFALTDNVKEIISYLKTRYDFWQYFKHITVSANVGLLKPCKEIFDYTLRENDLLPQETLFIDDHLPNVQGANLVGLHTILFSDAGACLVELKKMGINVLG